MPYTGNPASSATDRIRLNVGDTDTSLEYLSDAEYTYLLTKNSSNELNASIEAARIILFHLSRFTRERAGLIEVYGSERFKQYKDALLEWLNNPSLNSVVAVPYAGGISVEDMQANADNRDRVNSVPYIGITDSLTLYGYDKNEPEDSGYIWER